MAACGGGGSGSDGSAGGSATATATVQAPTVAPSSGTGESRATVVQATRLAHQASFGPNPALVQAIQAQGLEGWVRGQLVTNGSRYSRGGGPDVHRWTGSGGYCDTKGSSCWRDNFSAEPLLWDFYRNALGQPDQLRQRVAFALSQILVVSDLEVSGTYGLRRYHQLFLDNAFAPYGTLLKAVAKSPVMGDYLNNVNNSKTAPNENFARELLQLFSLGTCLLDSDGSLQGGRCQPVYDNTTVRQYAYGLTGWTYPAGGVAAWSCGSGLNCRFYDGDMVPVASRHDNEARTLLAGFSLPANHSADTALDTVIASLVAHPNMPPFIGRQLIQHLVTSNPSGAYVARVAAAFAAGRFQAPGGAIGSGMRGDLAATVAAVLLDDEARTATPGPAFGKLREPVLFMTGVLRALDGVTDGEALSWWWGGAMNQHVFKPPSVFSYFPPDYPLPGQGGSLQAPTFALHNASTLLGRLNYLHYLLFWGGTAAANSSVPEPLGTRVDLSGWAAQADDAAALVDAMAVRALGAPLPTSARSKVIDAVAAYNSGNDGNNWRLNRVRQAAYLVFASPHYQVQR